MDEMLQYIGTKIIKAVAMTSHEWRACLQAKGNEVATEAGEDTPGYKVVYEDGYESWSPKDVFDAAYRRCDAMTFGLAQEAMKKGLKVRLPHWAPDVYISLQSPDEHSKMTHPYLYVTSRYGMVPWISTVVEMFSEKWAIVE